jgi:hypothetical protein
MGKKKHDDDDDDELADDAQTYTDVPDARPRAYTPPPRRSPSCPHSASAT